MLYNKKKWLAAVFMIPFTVFVSMFIFYPAFVNVLYTFRDYGNNGALGNLIDGNYTVVGFENIINVFTHNLFWTSIKNTLILIFFILVLQIGLALVFAILINSMKKYANIYRIIFFMPIVLSGIALGTMYRMMIMPDGMFTILFGVVDWIHIENGFLSLWIIMLPMIWQYIGFYFVILLTGLAGIPEDAMEACALDGCNPLQKMFYITLPMLWNVLRTCIVLAITGALKVFDFPYTIAQNGAPAGTTHFMGTLNYSLYSSYEYGMTAFYSLLIVVFGVLVSFIANTIFRENKDLLG